MAEKTAVPAKAAAATPARWEPFRMLDAMEQEMGRRWPFGAWPTPWPRPGVAAATAWAPRTDVYKKNGDLVVKAELPGVKKEDVHVTVDAGDLVIDGERRAESEVEEADYYRWERSRGSFHRRIALPEGVATDAIKATFADGVLEVDVPLPAAAEATPRAIPIT